MNHCAFCFHENICGESSSRQWCDRYRHGTNYPSPNKQLEIRTSHRSYRGPGRLDITVKGKDPLGVHFAPTWDLVISFKSFQSGGRGINEAQYTERYRDLILNRLARDRSPLDTLLKWERVVFVCYCQPHQFCHRYILKDILVDLVGAVFCGELELGRLSDQS